MTYLQLVNSVLRRLREEEVESDLDENELKSNTDRVLIRNDAGKNAPLFNLAGYNYYFKENQIFCFFNDENDPLEVMMIG